jgi:uncharacterized protein DUF4190/putative regulator of septum formation
MGLRFNPAPGWPPPPPGFVPPPGWQPDPAWPPAPPGWQLWVQDDTVPDGFGPIGAPLSAPPGGGETTLAPGGYAPGAGSGSPGYSWGYLRPPSPGPPNSFAVACFIVSLFGFTVVGIVVSVVFGILALLRIRERPQRGRGFAIAGLVISCVWFLFFTLVIVLGIASSPQQAKSQGSLPRSGRGGVSVFHLRPGQCFHNPPSGRTEFGVTQVSVVPCTVPHDAQVFAVFRARGTAFPGQAGLRHQAAVGCRRRLAGNVDKTKVRRDMSLRFLVPVAGSWGNGQRRITCFILNTRQQMIYSLVPVNSTG